MPADIRNFFGGKGSQSGSVAPNAPKTEAQSPFPPKIKRAYQVSLSQVQAAKRTGPGRGKRKIVSDEEDEVEPTAESPPSKQTRPKKARKSAVDEEVTTSDYFSSAKKQTRSTPKKQDAKAPPTALQKVTTPAKLAPQNGTPKSTSSTVRRSGQKPEPDSTRSLRISSRKSTRKNYQEQSASEEGEEPAEDIFIAEYKGRKKAFDEYESASSDEDVAEQTAKPKQRGTRKVPVSPSKGDDDDAQPSKRSRAEKSRASKSSPKKPRKPKDAEAVNEDPVLQKILDDIPTVRAPSPPPQDAGRKFNYAANAARSQPAPNAGSKEIPEGAENCLTGLTFVFTGILDALGREEGQDLVKRYGGKVTMSPSSKTDYVVLGTDAGPKKLETIKKFNLKPINEDGLFALIRTLPPHGGSGQAAMKAKEKQLAEEEKVRRDAEQQEKELAADMKRKAAILPDSSNQTGPNIARLDDQLWTVKYAPTQLNQICGNKVQVEKLQNWLKNWQKNAKIGFKKGGPDGLGFYRAVMIYGGPGVGKTTAAHLVARLEGYDIVESNASDTRSKRLVEAGLKGLLDTTSLRGYFAANGRKAESTMKRLVLIMDEVDGMSAGDRGGVGAMASVCKKTNIPIILICNDRKLPKMRPFDSVTFDLPFRKPTTDQVRSRIMTILFREGINKMIPTNVVNALIEGSGADIRRIINMVSTAKLDSQALDYSEGKKMTDAWEKNIILKPWDITQKILGGGLFASSSKATLNEKAELYFNDHEFSFLMLQENYLHTNPILANSLQGRERDLKLLDLVDKAAASISDGDLVDAMIHGPQQHWSLMPTHAMFSFVRPASYVSGSTAGNRIQFTTWLGNNSKQGKLIRFVKDIQGHMRLRASADRHEIRQQYLPLLWLRLVKMLEVRGNDPQCIDDVIQLMDSYYLTKDDWDAIVELGVGPQDADRVKLSPQTKSNFTRKYNASSHPLPFLKAGGAPATAKASKTKPDLEEAIEESDDDALLDPAVDEGDDEELDLKKDKYVQAPKKRKAAPKKRAREISAAEDEDASESEGPSSKRGKVKGKGKGKASRGRPTKS